jgi:hypothetical protein
MSKNKIHNKTFIHKDEPLFDPYQFNLYFQRRVDDLIKLELTAMFQKIYWEQPF